MKIKTFPLRFTEEELNKIHKDAKKEGLHVKDYIKSKIEKFDGLTPQELDILAICAFRYTDNDKGDIAASVAIILNKMWDSLSPVVKDALVKEGWNV